jgi:hypothetical protein
MANEFSLSKLAAALKAVNDAGEALARSALDAKPNKDGKVAVDDIEPLKKALVGVWDCIAPRGNDTDPALAEQETLRRKQEVATGDRKKANDSLRDVRGVGPTSPFAGCGPYLDQSPTDSRFSVDGIFAAEGQASSADSSLDLIFTRQPLGEG